MTPRILALDLSLTSTGYCADGRCGRITTKLRGMERIEYIHDRIVDLSYQADVAVVEGYSYGSKGRAVFQVAGLGEIVRYVLWLNGCPYVDVPPTTLKKYATGRGNAGKDDMLAAAIRRFGFEGDGNDEADAYLLWCMAMHAYGQRVVNLPAAQEAAIDKVEWPEVKGGVAVPA
jgi:crossover junction endodeoxyribonuclease RuvC